MGGVLRVARFLVNNFSQFGVLDMKFILALLASATVAVSTYAANDQVKLDRDGLSITGTGCKKFDKNGTGAGDVQATISADGQSLSILFNSYNANAGGMNDMGLPRKNNDRKTCNMRIPLIVPAGYSVSVVQVDYRGFNSLPEGGSSKFSAEYFFAGMKGPRAYREFPDRSPDGSVDRSTGRLDKEFFIRNELLATAVNWSPCGKPVNLAINTWTQVLSNASLEDASISVDSADITASTPVVYKLSYRTCKN